MKLKKGDKVIIPTGTGIVHIEEDSQGFLTIKMTSFNGVGYPALYQGVHKTNVKADENIKK